jgi:acetolactate synthase-1/2/3 large subunit
VQINLSEIIIKELLKNNIDTAFIVAGGGSMFLVDAIGKSRMKKYYLHHEQSCSMAAEGYAKVLNKPALVCVTTGPGGINAINGVFGAHVDSCPMIIISGQVKRSTNKNFQRFKNLRQLGDQENDIIKMVKYISKYSILIKTHKNITSVIKKCVKISTTGRPGPVWIDIPVDLQGKKINQN